jgi:hypothetical protein
VEKMVKQTNTEKNLESQGIPFETDGWTEKSVIQFKFEKVGDTIQGRYSGQKDVALNDRVVKQVILDTGTGMSSFLLTAQLLDAFSNIIEGSLVKVVFTGTQKVAHGTLKTFKVYTKSA